MSLLGADSPTESVAETAEKVEEKVTDESPPKTDSTSFKLARVLFGGVLAFTAADNLRNLDENIAYAEGKDAPMAETSVPAISGSLLFGGLGIAAWKLPRLAAGAVATFLAAITPVMHDFWSVDEDQQEQEMVHFLKNAALLGGALAFLRVAEDD